MKYWEKYHWPGNVRQLENEINRLVNLCDEGDAIRDDLISASIKMSSEAKPGQRVSRFVQEGKGEREQILNLLRANNWNKSQAARELNMTYQGLHKKMRRLGMKPVKKQSK